MGILNSRWRNEEIRFWLDQFLTKMVGVSFERQGFRRRSKNEKTDLSYPQVTHEPLLDLMTDLNAGFLISSSSTFLARSKSLPSFGGPTIISLPKGILNINDPNQRENKIGKLSISPLSFNLFFNKILEWYFYLDLVIL